MKKLSQLTASNAAIIDTCESVDEAMILVQSSVEARLGRIFSVDRCIPLVISALVALFDHIPSAQVQTLTVLDDRNLLKKSKSQKSMTGNGAALNLEPVSVLEVNLAWLQ